MPQARVVLAPGAEPGQALADAEGLWKSKAKPSTGSRLLAHAPHGQLPVTNGGGAFVGVVTARALAEALADGNHDTAPVASLVEELPSVTTATTLDDALEAADMAGVTALPVFDEGRDNFVGWLTLQSVLNVLRPPSADVRGPAIRKATS